MKYYFKKFAKQKIQSESDGFVWLLYFVYCSLIDVDLNGGEIWENLKRRIKEFNLDKRTPIRVKNVSAFLLRNLGSDASATFNYQVSKIKTLQVKDFRGFGSQFNGDDKGVCIEFNSNNTIFYGPNGSGKSSLCDALEFKLTGQVRESARRNRRVSEYVKRIGSTSNPSLSISFVNPAIDGEKLTEDEKKYYSQAFIEKNRIQEFSLFGSKDTGIKKEEVLSILIGMDDLSNLVKSFVQPTSFKTNLLSFKRSDIANRIASLNAANVSNTTLKKEHEDSIRIEKAKADKLLLKTDATISDLEAELVKIDEAIKATNADTLSLSTTAIQFHSKQDFETAIQILEGNLQRFDELTSALNDAKTNVSFSNLYTAILELQSTVTDVCPSCDTPLENTTKNPFSKANEELVKLQGIKELEAEFNAHKTLVEQNLKSLEHLHNQLNFNTTKITALTGLIASGTALHTASPEYSLTNRPQIDTTVASIKSQLATISSYFTEVATLHERQSQKQIAINANNAKVSALNDRKRSIESIKTNWENTQTKLDAVNLALGTYTTDLSNLYNEKIIEDNYNSFIELLITSYSNFYTQLQEFKDKEFQTRFGKLESEIAGFYTQINKHDAEHEIVESFKIDNSNSDYKIEFKVKGSSLTEDASIKLSEGHLRSLGLSILLANAKINSLPFIIFDDVVNAIDSDHRANIIEMMVNDTYLNSVQQIVSTHDRLYWERFSLENQRGNFSSYILKCTKQGVVHYHYNLSFRDKIQNALNHFDIRQALLYSRIWFETIAKQYCMENNIELSGTLKKSEFHVSIEPSLGAIYRELFNKLGDNENLKVLHKDEINYKGINQEHHSFDEYNFNFIHSRTSNEVQKIFDAVSGLDDDIQFLKSHQLLLAELLKSQKHSVEKLKTLNTRMPIEIQNGIINRHNEILNQLSEFPARMQNLRIDAALIKSTQEKISKVFLGGLLSALMKSKGIA
ncbi:MAG TPA: AAA family ATPase [Ferruginibacter sp.]|nr:AAA family ATPase [Ferruginibacter sp.]